MKRIVSLILLSLMVTLLCPAFADGETAGVIDLYLEENASTGYVWLASSTDEAVVRVEALEEPEETELTCDQPGTAHLRVLAVQPGTAELRFTYARPWESVQPLVQLSIPVTVDENQRIISGAEIFLSGQENSWSCTAENEQITVESEYDPQAQLFRFCPLIPSDSEERLIFANAQNPQGFAFDILVQDGVLQISSVNYYFSLLPQDGSVPFAPEFLFTTTDLEGNPITEQIFGGQKLTILNFWEPWCGPCVSEMPHLQKLSQEYADEVLILGVYATPNAEEDVQLVLESTGVSYPIVHYTDEFAFLQTGYVPTTVVVNQSGAVVRKPFAGALSYEGWVKLVEELL